MKHQRCYILILLSMLNITLLNCNSENVSEIEWQHLSTVNGDLPNPDVGSQVSTLIMDIDKDGVNDFVIAGWGKPSMVWFRKTTAGWERYLIEPGVEYIEAGGDFADIDRDGDLDIVQGGDWRTLKEVWWWENPYPEFDPDKAWNRYLVKNSDEGGKGHHDQIFGDFDGDGELELVFWNTDAYKLFLADIPDDPYKKQPWNLHLIKQFEKPPSGKYEGLAKGDIDLDGLTDIVGGGYWFKNENNNQFSAHTIDADYWGSRSAIGDLIKGGRPEVVLASGDHVNPLIVYQWKGSKWQKQILLDKIERGHSLQVADINGDGNLDIYCAEMAQWARGKGKNPNAKAWIFYGNSQGEFEQQLVSVGIGNHESKIGDLDGDGDLDILGKPFEWGNSRLDIWLNNGSNQ